MLEYLEGKTLRHLMEERAGQAGPGGRQDDVRGLSVARTLEMMLPMLRALERAHGIGIVHRDLKPENIILTDGGVVKVLDFGIAKSVLAAPDGAMSAAECPADNPGHSFKLTWATLTPRTKTGSLIGTLPYMSPEQLDAVAVDHRADIWAAGIMLFEMIAGHHPLAPLSMLTFERIADVSIPMPPTSDLCTTVGVLAPIIDRCLLKDKADRIGSVTELIAELELLIPGHRSLALADDTSPFAGLSAFQESDADRFFGRSEDTLAVVSRVREQPLVAVIGPSGVGKSSLMRAGVIPVLKRSGEGWQSLIARPGRAPLLALAELVDRLEMAATTWQWDSSTRRPGALGAADSTAPAGGAGVADEATKAACREATVDRLRAEPGYLGAILRRYAHRKLRRVLLFIDQFEELYTLCTDEDERAAFLGCLAGVADDAGSPLRVALSMRADFLERLAENRSFMGVATRGLTLLPPMGRAGLQDALEKPLAAVGYGFESGQTVRDMLDELDRTRGALPLLQFAATTLWKERDRERRLLTEDGYRAMGGIAGTLARHADSVVAAMTESRRKLARAVFERLVTPERTRAVVSVAELREMGGGDGDAVEEVLDELARARLVVVDTETAEIVHESLLERWPMLRRWLDEHQGDAEFLARLRASAQRWEQAGRPDGMLWRGDAALEIHSWRARYDGELANRERQYLAAVLALSQRGARVKRMAMVGTIAFLSLLVVAASFAILWIRQAERDATQKAEQLDAQLRKNQEMNAQLTDSLRSEETARREAEEAEKAAERAKDEALEAEARALAEADKARRATAEASRSRDKANSARAAARDSESLAQEARKRAEDAATREQNAADGERRTSETLQKVIERANGAQLTKELE